MRLGCAVGNRAYRGGMSVMRLGCAVGNRAYRGRQAFASGLLVTLCFVWLRPLVFQFGNARCLFGIPRF